MEYMYLEVESGGQWLLNRLNELGKEGWMLCLKANESTLTYILMRPYSTRFDPSAVNIHAGYQGEL